MEFCSKHPQNKANKKCVLCEFPICDSNFHIFKINKKKQLNLCTTCFYIVYHELKANLWKKLLISTLLILGILVMTLIFYFYNNGKLVILLVPVIAILILLCDFLRNKWWEEREIGENELQDLFSEEIWFFPTLVQYEMIKLRESLIPMLIQIHSLEMKNNLLSTPKHQLFHLTSLKKINKENWELIWRDLKLKTEKKQKNFRNETNIDQLYSWSSMEKNFPNSHNLLMIEELLNAICLESLPIRLVYELREIISKKNNWNLKLNEEIKNRKLPEI